MPAIRHHKITVEGLGVFVREAGDPAKPSIVLLPGYPSSTRAYVRLIDRLARDSPGGSRHCRAAPLAHNSRSRDRSCPDDRVRSAKQNIYA
jgi:pimeloyl-ACP methyl ester carboxylesterase